MDTKRFAMNYGAILGLCLVTLSVISWAVGINDKESIIPGLLNIGLTIAFITYTIIQYRDIYNNGLISYGASLKLGTTIAFFSSVIVAFYFIIHISYIDTNFVSDSLSQTEIYLDQDGEISDEELDAQMEAAAKYMTLPWLMAINVLGGTFSGFFYSLVISFFVKKDESLVSSVSDIVENTESPTEEVKAEGNTESTAKETEEENPLT